MSCSDRRCVCVFLRGVAVAVVGLSAIFAATACGSGNGPAGGDKATKDVEVFTWWADGGEKAGLDGLVSQFGTDCADYKFVNGAIAGGAGSTAKTVLAQRLADQHPAVDLPGSRRRGVE